MTIDRRLRNRNARGSRLTIRDPVNRSAAIAVARETRHLVWIVVGGAIYNLHSSSYRYDELLR